MATKKSVSFKEQSFAKSLYFGNILEEMVFPYPEVPSEEKETVDLFIDSFRKFSKKHINPREMEKEKKIPKDVLQGLAELGLFGLSFPQRFGGAGLSNTAYARIMEEVCHLDASLGVTLGGHQSIGCQGIALFGTPEQKKKYLPDCASGKTLAAFALTEPDAGSDAAGIKTKAILSDDKKYYILNGSKIWITNGAIADLFTVFAKTQIPGEKGEEAWKITAFIVTRDMGVEHGSEENKMGIRASSTTSLFFKDTKVPVENVLGEVGKGFKVAMEILNKGRLGLAAGCLGGSKRAIELAEEHAKNRIAFRRPIAQFGMIQDKIANMLMDCFANESMVYMTTGLIDRGVEDYSVESAICKVFSSESAWRIINEAMQIGAGSAYMQDYPYEQLLRDARINIIFEGTNEILRCFITLSGMQGPGNYLKEVGKSLQYPLKGIGPLYQFAIKKISRDVIGIGDRITRADTTFKKESAVIEDYTKELAQHVEYVLRKYGKDIWDREFIQKRISNIVIDLYAMICTISRVTHFIQKQGLEKSKFSIHLAQAFCERAERRIKRNFKAMQHNDDERLKLLADTQYKHKDYPFDCFS
ncbi:MAG: acyl-CoA dehydrogenase family protein [Deltaproteobacteria bacterium]|nr:acyl-CoA dehydrogenase family protein [Deltaproteobacteria bacterium]